LDLGFIFHGGGLGQNFGASEAVHAGARLCNFMDEDEENLSSILPLATEILKSWNLLVIASMKTNLTSFTVCT
jgi:hypothetical protein